MKKLIKVYLYSFPFISICGLIQFFMPILHFKPFLVLQWWIPDVLPRINAFSYEPSYFATYMILGWVLTAYLLQTKSSLVKMSHLTVIFLLETTVMILSSSRMGWIMMVFWFSQFPLLFLWRIINTKVNKKYLNYTLWLCLLSVITIFTVVYVVGVNKVLFLMNGIGIGNTSSHSVDIRSKELADTIKIFLESPIWGYSLGGIAWAIGNLRGIDVNNLELAKSNEGMSVFGEVLAASGIIGFIPFAIYIGSLIILPLKLAIRISNTEMKIILRGMVYSLIFILVILQFNQNILRPYLWLHIAILSAVYFAAKREVSYVNTNN
ncbi:hypothetical protein [Paenibacillus sp. V4I7]|uniref:hypothetical protein n=1 Tax=Paenibacillus sp. V4I7 TaxID=3042307 RepID=UPI00278A6A6E|nr:hypothetical protein [Paenibacillus sp. V4I7]MDQ0903917.1 hypothetical protein [Paenibacillus sp. V4I7]